MPLANLDREQLIESIALAMVHLRERNYRLLTTWDEVSFEIGPHAAADWIEAAKLAVVMVEKDAEERRQ